MLRRLKKNLSLLTLLFIFSTLSPLWASTSEKPQETKSQGQTALEELRAMAKEAEKDKFGLAIRLNYLTPPLSVWTENLLNNKFIRAYMNVTLNLIPTQKGNCLQLLQEMADFNYQGTMFMANTWARNANRAALQAIGDLFMSLPPGDEAVKTSLQLGKYQSINYSELYHGGNGIYEQYIFENWETVNKEIQKAYSTLPRYVYAEPSQRDVNADRPNGDALDRALKELRTSD